MLLFLRSEQPLAPNAKLSRLQCVICLIIAVSILIGHDICSRRVLCKGKESTIQWRQNGPDDAWNPLMYIEQFAQPIPKNIQIRDTGTLWGESTGHHM